MKQAAPIIAFNRGVVSRLGLARIDVPRMRMAAATQRNWMPRVLGSMMLRPGLQYRATTKSSAFARAIPYVRSSSVDARLELTDSVLRVLIDDVAITRPAVTAAVTNGDFSSLVGWTDADEAGAQSTLHATNALELFGTGTNAAIRRQQVTVNEASVEHALRIVVSRGPITLRVGSSSAGEQYIGETELGTGSHSLAFTPTGDFHIQLSSLKSYPVLVDSITVEAAGVMELPTPWTEALLPDIRHSTSADVVFVACSGDVQQRKIERRGERSWSITLYEPLNGPFRLLNTTNITITSNVLSGSGFLTASKPLFRAGHVGALFRQDSPGQTVTEAITAQNTFSDPIRVFGLSANRAFGIIVSGTFVATVVVQYSVGEPGSWIDLPSHSYTAPTTTSHNDALDNQVIYYRIGVKTGDFTSGTVDVSLTYASGSLTGVARITGFASETSLEMVVLQDFGSLSASSDWWEGEWSPYRNYPSALALHEGRLWHAGGDKIWASSSDLYEDFDDETEGDAGPISRSIGEGPVDSVHWLLPLGRILLGTALNSAPIPAVKIDGRNVMAARSTSLDEPITPTNFSMKNTAVKGVFVDRSQQRLFELAYSIESNDYVPEDLTVLVPDLNEAGIAGVAVQMTPDVRLHCWRNDGTVGVLVFDRAETVICWVEVETDGDVEDVTVLPGVEEDRVYYIVKRAINGSTVRYHEKWALESECTGQPEAYLADSHYRYSGAATTTITGLTHLEGEEVVVWGWNTTTPFTDDEDNVVGQDFGTFTVTGAQITGLSAAVTDACVGIAYVAEFESSKQAFIEALGSPLNQMRRIAQLGLVLVDTHYQGLRYGDSLDNDEMHDLSRAERIKVTDELKVWSELETRLFPLHGHWDTDSRLCLRAASPRPCTVLAATVGLESNSKAA